MREGLVAFVVTACGVAVCLFAIFRWLPAPRPVPVAARDTVWLGCTWVETKDGKVIVKYERVKNPVLWDSLREAK